MTLTTDTFLFISHTMKVLLFKFRCNIFIGVRIIKEMPGSVASGTLCIIESLLQLEGCASQFVKELCFFSFSPFNPFYPSMNSTHVHTYPTIHLEQVFGNADLPQQPKKSVTALSVKRTSVSAILESTVVLPPAIKQLLLLGSGREFSST